MATIDQGTTFGGRYVVQSQVGTGGMATVYRGVDTTLNRTVAIKVMLPQYATDPAFAARFKQEAQAAAALQNPYIVQVYDWGQDMMTGTYYIVMEYLRGTDLKTGIRSHGALAPRKVAQIGAQVCSALSVAHAHDIIHRDIKPQNIMIQPNGNAKVMDFGIARAKNSHLTQTNSVLGTAHYVSPEQAQGKALGPTSDLYSLGVVMYEAATGKLPFDGDDAVTVALKQVNDEPVPPSQVNPNVDNVLESIILRLMSKEPRARFQSADELRRVLNDYIMGRPVQTPLVTTVMNNQQTGTVNQGGASRTQQMPIDGNVVTGVKQGGARMIKETEKYNPSRRNPGLTSTAAERARAGADRDQPKARGTATGVVVALFVGLALIGGIVFALMSCENRIAPTGGATPGGNHGGQVATTAAGTVAVPTLTGYTETEAASLLAQAGLAKGIVSTQASDTVASGKIISQSPAAGSQATEGSQVSIVVSTGPDRVDVPNLRGKTEVEVAQLLTAAGLNGSHDASLDGYVTKDDTDLPEGTVMAYSPANQQVARGSLVRYGLSKGVDPETLKTQVPNVYGWWYTEAENALANVELDYYEAFIYDNATEWGIVLYTNPDPGTELDKHTIVDLYISAGPEPYDMPDYAGDGYSADAAQGDLTGRGVNVWLDTNTPAPSESQVGMVYATSPGAGDEVVAGDTVTVYAYGPVAAAEPEEVEPEPAPDEEDETTTTTGADEEDEE